MRVVALGTDGTWPGPGGATSGYLVSHDGFSLWMDAGTGTMANLQRSVGVDEVGAIVVSHAHQDHFVDLYPLLYARILRDRPLPPLPLFAPPGFADRAVALLGDESAAAFVRAFDVRPVEPGESFEAGPFRMRTAPMRHWVPTLGLRVEADGHSVAYSADTGPTDELVGLAREADVLLCEATLLERTPSSPDLHLSAAEAGEHAARADVGRLVITHTRWRRADAELGLAAAAAPYGGPVALAEEGMVVVDS